MLNTIHSLLVWRRNLLGRSSQLPRFFLILAPFCPTLMWAQTGVPDQEDCATPLIAAIHKRDTVAAIKIIDSGADLDTRTCVGQTALMESIVYDEMEVVQKLIVKVANVNQLTARTTSPLMIGALYCSPDIIQLMLTHVASVY